MDRVGYLRIVDGLWSRLASDVVRSSELEALFSQAEISEISWLLGFPVRAPVRLCAPSGVCGAVASCKLHARWLHNKTPAL